MGLHRRQRADVENVNEMVSRASIADPCLAFIRRQADAAGIGVPVRVPGHRPDRGRESRLVSDPESELVLVSVSVSALALELEPALASVSV